MVSASDQADEPRPFAEWLDAIADGRLSMSQRQVSWAEKLGGLDARVAAARRRGVHLVQLTDDKGKRLIAASREPFKHLC